VLSTGDLLLHQPRAVGISERSVVQSRRAPPLGGAQILCYFRLPLQAIGDELRHTFRQKVRVRPGVFHRLLDRLIGVSLGILLKWFVFDQIWPVRTSDARRKSCFASSRCGPQFDVAASKKSPSVRDGLGNLVFDRS
jgi:hypothetical protein